MRFDCTFFTHPSIATEKGNSLGQGLDHGHNRNFHRRHSHERERHVPNEWGLGDKLESEPDGSDEGLDLDPEGDWNVEPVEGADEELDEKVNVLGAELVGLSRLSRVCEGDLEVDVVSRLVKIRSRSRAGLVVGGGGRGRRFTLVNPLLARVPKGNKAKKRSASRRIERRGPRTHFLSVGWSGSPRIERIRKGLTP